MAEEENEKVSEPKKCSMLTAAEPSVLPLLVVAEVVLVVAENWKKL